MLVNVPNVCHIILLLILVWMSFRMLFKDDNCCYIMMFHLYHIVLVVTTYLIWMIDCMWLYHIVISTKSLFVLLPLDVCLFLFSPLWYLCFFCYLSLLVALLLFKLHLQCIIIFVEDYFFLLILFSLFYNWSDLTTLANVVSTVSNTEGNISKVF